jgi:hypothetical protein
MRSSHQDGDRNVQRVLNLLRSRGTTGTDTRKMKQQQLRVSELSQTLADYLRNNKMFNTEEFFRLFILPPGFILRPHQEEMIRILASDIAMEGLSNLGYRHSRLFIAPTAAGKSIVEEYLMTVVAESFVPLATGKPRQLCGVIACSTIQLATETWNRLQKPWISYYKAAMSCSDLEFKNKALLPILAYNAEKIAFPRLQIKLVAGGTGKESIWIDNETLSSEGLPLPEGEKLKGKNIAMILVVTYEHLVSLLARACDVVVLPWLPNVQFRIIDHIGFCIFDEAHNVEMGRSSAAGLRMWLQQRNIWTIFLTATASLSLSTTLGCTVETTHHFRVSRKFPRVIYPMKCFPNDVVLAVSMAEMGFAAWIQGITFNRVFRTAIFIENKLVLKAVLCLVIHQIMRDTDSYYPGEGFDSMIHDDPHYFDLENVLLKDPAVIYDDIPYGELCLDECKITFKEAILFAAKLGIFINTADFATLTRKRISLILSTQGVPWTLVLASSTLAEGCNMTLLSVVIVGASAGTQSKQAFIPTFKVAQEVGRVDREDFGGFALMPRVESLAEDSTVINRYELISTLFNFGIPKIDAETLLRQLQFSDSFYITKIFEVSDYVDMFINEKVISQYTSNPQEIRGYERIPYFFNKSLHILPAFPIFEVDRVELARPCLMQRIYKQFMRSKQEFNLHFFSYDIVCAQFLSWHPPLLQLAVAVIHLKLPQWNSHTPLNAKRLKHYITFYEKKLEIILSIPVIKEIYSNILELMTILWNVKLPQLKHTDWLCLRPKLIFKGEISALSVFLTCYLTAVRGWEIICSEWSVYRPFLSSFQGDLDGLIMTLIDNPLFLISKFQREALHTLPEDFMNPQQVLETAALFDDPTAQVAQFGDIPNNTVCCCVNESIPVHINPYNQISPYSQSIITILENPMLLVICQAALQVKTMFGLDADKEITLSTWRKKLDVPTTLPGRPMSINYGIGNGGRYNRYMLFDVYGRVIETDANSLDLQLMALTRSI